MMLSYDSCETAFIWQGQLDEHWAWKMADEIGKETEIAWKFASKGNAFSVGTDVLDFEINLIKSKLKAPENPTHVNCTETRKSISKDQTFQLEKVEWS